LTAAKAKTPVNFASLWISHQKAIVLGRECMTEQTKRLFQGPASESGPVECLGQKFPNEEARRKHFLKLLAEKLKEPEFRKIDGFPSGTDETILAMSDPPYYTACPNPFLAEFVRRYGKPYDPTIKYTREPMAIDISVGKTDSLYKAHPYHTKVPHLAIVPSILHYTEPGEVVLDGFAGSGMTGVAAQWCGIPTSEFRHKIEAEMKKKGKPGPEWGPRRVILNDLSPAASYIAANYNIPFDVDAFQQAGRSLLDNLEKEVGWMYSTMHADGKTKGRIEYTVWSEVFNCPECLGEVDFLIEALVDETEKVRDAFPCPHCTAELTKRRLEKVYESKWDPVLKKAVQFAKRKPSLICYAVGGKRWEKKPDQNDLAVIKKINDLSFPEALPVDRMMHAPEREENWGDKWRAGTASFSHVHHLFVPRAGHALARLWNDARNHPDLRMRNMLMFFAEQAIWGMSLLARYTPTHYSQVNQYLSGVFYVSSLHAECSPWYILDGKLDRLIKTFRGFRPRNGNVLTSVGSANAIGIPNNSVDYIFTDPPFGDNLAYSELNFIVEAFHQVFTSQAPEAVVSDAQAKGLLEYHKLMHSCFAEYYRVLKPGRWMTVVFSNTQAAVWNGIQTALQQAGFVVANVSALNKVQGGFNAVTNPTSVKQDLVISAYKPNDGLEDRFRITGGNIESAWDFAEIHLRHLPILRIKDKSLEFVVERDPRILFDRMVAWFVQHNTAVPLSSQEFQEGLRQRFIERDGMIFLPDQLPEYDKRRAETAQAPQVELFVFDERSAIDWLTDFLKKRPSTYQEISPIFMAQLGASWKKHESRPELSALLETNFLKFDGNEDVPSQIHSYLSSNYKDLRSLSKDNKALIAKAADRWYVPDPNKAQDLEKKREKVLLKEFATYQASTARRLKEFRLEVLRAGFKAAWTAKDYKTIIAVAQKIPDEALQEDEKLLLWYDQALTRTEAGD
jgi:DNA modification methylase